jgi:hypothetical protein
MARLDQAHEKGGSRTAPRLADHLHEGEFSGPVGGDVEVELALGGLDLGNVDVKVADGIGLERPFGRLVAFDLGQPRDASDAGGIGTAMIASALENWPGGQRQLSSGKSVAAGRR